MPQMVVSVNPLRCLDIDLPQPGAPAPSADRLLDYLFAPQAERTIEGFVRRYRELLSGVAVSQLAPGESTILRKLVAPLKQAIGNYCLGDYLAVIALCGHVAEMAAILLWEISEWPNRPAGEEVQKMLRGESFENADQSRRVDVLRFLGVIDSKTKGDFSAIRIARGTYLHILSASHDAIATDARKAFVAAANIMTSVLGVSYPSPGVIAFRPELMAYLNSKGLVEG